jgi:hypothetical protein
LKKVLVVVILFLVLLFGFLVLRFGSALTQEGNTISILTSIMKLELSNNKYEKISDTKNKLTYVSDYKKNSPYRTAEQFMKEKGWDFKEQIGSGLVFEKSGEVIVIETRQFSRHYFLWSVPNEIML